MWTAAAITSLTFIPHTAWAGNLGDAVSAHRYDEHDKAFPMFKQLAEAGDARAQFYLGHMYKYGEGVKRSKKKAKKWIMMAAENGDDHAKVTLGEMYYSGNGIKESTEQACALFKEASDNNHPVGRYNLATCYRWGNGVVQDEQLAFNLYSQVTRMDSFSEHLWAMDRWDVLRTVKQMADNGARETLTTEQADAIKTKKENQERRAAEAKTQRLADEAKAVADLKARLVRAGPLDNGLNAFLAGNFAAAFPIIMAHAENGNALAQDFAGQMYRDGKGTEQNDKAAEQWFLKSGDNGHGPAYYQFAEMAYNHRITLETGLINRRFKSWEFRSTGFEAMEMAANLNYQPAMSFVQNYYDRKAAEEANRKRLQAQREERERTQARGQKSNDDVYVEKPCRTVYSYQNTHSGRIITAMISCN